MSSELTKDLSTQSIFQNIFFLYIKEQITEEQNFCTKYSLYIASPCSSTYINGPDPHIWKLGKTSADGLRI